MPPVLISTAVGAKAAVASRDMERKFRAVGRLLIAYFGDVPLSILNDDLLVKFLLWCRRLPRDHGKAHGRNRFEQTGREVDPWAEIAEAGERDAAARREIEAREDLSLADERVLLASRSCRG